MKKKLAYPLILALLVAACGNDRGRRNAAGYETVQEGSASGVTSTIHGPGEVLPPITETNADTTNAFTLDPNALPPPSSAPAVPQTQPQRTPVYVPPTQPPPQREPAPPPPTYTTPPSPPPPTNTAPPAHEPPPPAEEPEEEEEEPPPPPTTTDTRGQLAARA